MSKKKFTFEEIELLQHNKYVKKVSENGITYTTEFREDFAALIKNGKTTSEIFKILGFDTKILGEDRIYSTTNRIKQKLKKNESFEDTRTNKSGRKLKKVLSIEEELEKLKHEKLILEQENAFLKKMIFLGKKVTWEKSLLKNDTK